MIKDIYTLLNEHSFFKNIPDDHVKLIAGCGKNVHLKGGEYLAHEGDDADYFYIIRNGRAAIEVHTPTRGFQILQTLHSGDIAGWSWIFPPYKWSFDFKIVEDTSAIALDGKCLRSKCESDPAMGYTLMKEFAKIMTNRLRAARIQLLDVYGNPEPSN